MPEKDTVRIDVTPEMATLIEREAMRGVRWRNGVVAVMGLFGVAGGVSFFTDPTSVSSSPIGRNLSGPWDDMWSAAWLLGGLRPWQVVELFGWAFYVPAVMAYIVAVVVIAGNPPGLFLALSVALGGAAKIVYLLFYAPRAVSVRVERRRPTPAHEEPYEGEERRG
jgi:hypothetical protein